MATIPAEALAYVKGRGISITIAALLLLLFSRWLLHRRRGLDVLLVVPTAVMSVFSWSFITVSVTPTDWGLAASRNMTFYIPWIVYLCGYATAGLLYLLRGSKDLKEEYKVGYFQAVAIIVTLAAVLFAGLLGNVLFALLGTPQIPLLSSLLFVPGLAVLSFVVSLTRQGISSYVKRDVTRKNDVLHAFLVYSGGSLIASRGLDGLPVADEDIFSAVLEAIQSFVKVSLPAFDGWLNAIDHGDLKLLAERGTHCFLVLATSGREDDLLRGEMRDVLSRFEERNVEALARWDGDPDSLKGAQEVVSFFFEMHRVF